jgi:tellurite resistance protein
MAYLPKQEKKKEEENSSAQSAGKQLGTSSSVTGPTGGAVTGKPTSSGSFSNLSAYVTANKDQATRLADTVKQKTVNPSVQQYEKAKSKFQQDVTSATSNLNPLQSKAAQGGSLSDQEKQKFLTDYKKPSQLQRATDYSSYTEAAKKARDAQTNIDQFQSRDRAQNKGLIQKAFKAPEYSRGQGTLDTALFQRGRGNLNGDVLKDFQGVTGRATGVIDQANMTRKQLDAYYNKLHNEYLASLQPEPAPQVETSTPTMNVAPTITKGTQQQVSPKPTIQPEQPARRSNDQRFYDSYTKTYDRYLSEFQKDGQLDAREMSTLESLQKAIGELDQKLKQDPTQFDSLTRFSPEHGDALRASYDKGGVERIAALTQGGLPNVDIYNRLEPLGVDFSRLLSKNPAESEKFLENLGKFEEADAIMNRATGEALADGKYTQEEKRGLKRKAQGFEGLLGYLGFNEGSGPFDAYINQKVTEGSRDISASAVNLPLPRQVDTQVAPGVASTGALEIPTTQRAAVPMQPGGSTYANDQIGTGLGQVDILGSAEQTAPIRNTLGDVYKAPTQEELREYEKFINYPGVMSWFGGPR